MDITAADLAALKVLVDAYMDVESGPVGYNDLPKPTRIALMAAQANLTRALGEIEVTVGA
jgi:hypothetical protein